MLTASSMFDPAAIGGFLLDSSIKGSVVVLAGGGLALILRRRSAASRHTMWTAVVAAQLILPALSLVVPHWSVLPATHFAPETSTSAGLAGPNAGVGARIAVAIWCLGVVLLLARATHAHFQVSAKRRRARPVDWSELLQRTAVSLGVGKLPSLLESPDVQVPIVCGNGGYAIILPGNADCWSVSRRETVLLHEMAHIRRRDLLIERLASAASILFWFNPLTRVAVTRLRLECERACDDAVLSAGVAPASYIRELVELLKSAGTPPRTLSESLGLFSRSQIETRLVSLLDCGLPRHETGRGAQIAAVSALIVVAPVLAALSPKRTPIGPAAREMQAIPRASTAARVPPARTYRLSGPSRLVRRAPPEASFELTGSGSLAGPPRLVGAARIDNNNQ